MRYDFDKVYDRKDSNSLKWDFAHERGHSEDEIPMWVADMDFKAPGPVIDALNERVSKGFFGYTDPKQEDKEIVSNWYKRRHNFYPDPKSIVFTPGVVFGITVAILAFTEPEDAVMISEPVYYPFSEAVINNERKLIHHSLKYDRDGKYSFDIDSFESLIIENNVKIYILCSPHNPVGRVWTEEELQKIGEIALKHGVLVIADEIHADFVYEKNIFISYPSISENIRNNCILCTSPSKTFNTAGLQIASIMVFDDQKRKMYKKKLGAIGYSQVDVLALEAMKVSYTECDEWVDEVVNYIYRNFIYMESFLGLKLPQLKMIRTEGTYLAWVDFRSLGLNAGELEEFMKNKARLWLDEGYVFGKDGEGFERFNLACPIEILKESLKRLEKAVNSFSKGDMIWTTE